jgi:hypothetical protein
MDLGFETLPFNQFRPKQVIYYLMVIVFNLFECYERDVLGVGGCGSVGVARRGGIVFLWNGLVVG